MSIEAHLTVNHPERSEPALRGWLAQRALRITTIELAQGAWPRQRESFALEYPALAAGGREEWLARLEGGLRLLP